MLRCKSDQSAVYQVLLLFSFFKKLNIKKKKNVTNWIKIRAAPNRRLIVSRPEEAWSTKIVFVVKGWNTLHNFLNLNRFVKH